jgi:hypothetical protein
VGVEKVTAINRHRWDGACYKEEFLVMSFWISIAGGLLIMMGHHARSEALFYYFRLEDQVPESHLLLCCGCCNIAIGAHHPGLTSERKGLLSAVIIGKA